MKLGLIGAGIQGSRSPYLHETEARALGLDCSYRLIDLEQLPLSVESLPRLLDAVESHGYAGENITHPRKQAVIPLLDELSTEADLIGAVNTLVFREGRTINGISMVVFQGAEAFRLFTGVTPDAERMWQCLA